MLNFEATMADKKEIAHLKNTNAALLDTLSSLLYLAQIKDPTEKERTWSEAEQIYREAIAKEKP